MCRRYNWGERNNLRGNMLGRRQQVHKCLELGVPMIAYEIFKGATAEDLGMPEANYRSRKATLDKFLAQWTGAEATFTYDYLAWLREENKKHPSPKPIDGTEKPHPVEEEFSDRSYREMFAGLGESIKTIAASGMKLCDKEEHSRRYSICQACAKLDGSRCRVCGCFMKLKSKFGAMSCPLKYW